MTDAILVLNAGSSSLKFGLYTVEEQRLLCRGAIDPKGVRLVGPVAPELETSGQAADLKGWLDQLVPCVAGLPQLRVRAAGHRVVHGGARFDRPCLVDPAALDALEQLVPLAPRHQPQNLAGIRRVAETWPDIPQVACFDTEFHRSQPRLAQLFPLPRAFAERGVVRYGFHGLSYEHAVAVLPELLGPRADGRIVVAHLGQGASMCALLERRCLATTMGFTALDGLMMGTRSGAIDPGLVLHLLREGMTAEEIEDLLYNRSGLLGVSGISGDVRDLETSSDPRAREALELFAYRAVREIGSLVAALGGLDALVFTGGIGEHSALVRALICGGTSHLGLQLDQPANERNGTQISSASSAVTALIVHADEEAVIARRTAEATATA